VCNRIDLIVKRMQFLTELQIDEVHRLVTQLELNNRGPAPPPHRPQRNWPHAPTHRLHGNGTFIVTAGTYLKLHHFNNALKLDYLQERLLSLAMDFGWQLEAWACFTNHYHFVGHALFDAATLRPFLAKLHAETSRFVNDADQVMGRQVWHNFWETKITFENSYLARLNYVHQNPVKHGLTPVARQYPWCSAEWFEQTASRAQVNTIYGFKIDQLKVLDDFTSTMDAV
jgi:putative transposase